MDSLGLIIGAVALVVVIVGVIGFVLSRMKVVPQTDAMIVSGSRTEDGAKVIKPGGRAFIIPVVQSATFVPLGQVNIPLKVSGVDLNKVPITVDGVAMVKVEQSDEAIRAAAERFGSAGNSDNFEAEVQRNLQQVLTGSLRAAIASMTVEDLLVKREALAENVKETTDAQVKIMGIAVDTLQVLDISDQSDYISNLGKREAEKVAADARVAIAENNQRANDAEVKSKQAIAERARDLALREAELKAETDRATETAAASGPLAKAEQDKAIAKLKQETAEQEAALRERQLDIEVRKPADAEKYRVTVEAEAAAAETKIAAAANAERVKIAAAADAERTKIEADAAAAQVRFAAEAAAERVRLAGQAEADAVAANAKAESERVSSIGSAEAEAVKAKGLAEAESMDKKAEAYRKYGEAAILEILVNKAPEIARELAAPLSSIDRVTLIGGDGLSSLPGAVASNFEQLDNLSEQLIGIPLSSVVKGATAGTVAGKLSELMGGNEDVATSTATNVALNSESKSTEVDETE